MKKLASILSAFAAAFAGGAAVGKMADNGASLTNVETDTSIRASQAARDIIEDKLNSIDRSDYVLTAQGTSPYLQYRDWRRAYRPRVPGEERMFRETFPDKFKEKGAFSKFSNPDPLRGRGVNPAYRQQQLQRLREMQQMNQLESKPREVQAAFDEFKKN